MIRAVLRRLRSEERGYTLVEVVLVAVLVPVILGTVLTAASGFQSTVKRNQELSESQARTRETIDDLARNLRNLASPTLEQPQAVDRSEPFDLVFQTVGPTGSGGGANLANVMRVRYCLDQPASGPATLWKQTQTWNTAIAPPVPPTTTCPDAWPTPPRMMAAGLTNRLAATPRALFQFNSAIPTKVTAITVQAWVRSPGDKKEPREGALRSQVLLRNQNEAPVCGIQATPNGLLHVLLNGSASYDPEGKDLTYQWFDASDGDRALGTGIVLDASVNVPGFHDITLKCKDPAGLENTATVRVWVAA